MINQIVMDGYIGKDLELKTTQSLKKYVSFTICQNRYSKIQKCYVGEWHHAVAWNKVAEDLVAKVHKGLKVILAGEQRTRSFIDKNGNKVAYEYIWVNSFDVQVKMKCLQKLFLRIQIKQMMKSQKLTVPLWKQTKKINWQKNLLEVRKKYN
ncbi:single-stranded DNA-binding protein [Lactobacillus crispatus]|uniref:single-stranded DNA-binding protein n=1 Tax=Lactobacillus crispatus TaxID=47770 RepID=UPI000ABD0AD7|nr:single-stranded DNA-binding protein [Lactobacillus crispatus]